jgi:hypothetical protein
MSMNSRTPAAHAENRAAQIHVLETGQLWMKPRPHFDQGGQPPADRDFARRRHRDAGQQLENRALAGTVVTDDAERFALADLKGNVAQGPEFVHAPASQAVERPTQCAARALRAAVLTYAVPLGHTVQTEIDHAGVLPPE